jgi:hypothetical protein
MVFYSILIPLRAIAILVRSLLKEQTKTSTISCETFLMTQNAD